MGNTEDRPTVLSLCTGYGGLEIGLNRALGGVSVLAHVEVEAFAIANLVSKMETGQMVPAPIWTDLKTFRARSFRGGVDFLTGGYPCQPFSAAGKRAGKDDPRHLWPYIKNIVREIEPGGVFFENVEGHISLGVCEVLADLEEMGYEVAVGIFSATEVGAPHQRKRVFILGHASCHYERRTGESQGGRQEPLGGPSPQLADADVEGPQGRDSRVLQKYPSKFTTRPSGPWVWPARPGRPQHEWEEPRVVGETKPQLGRATNGTASRVDRLRLLGNGVVPQVAEKAFLTLHRELVG